ncbi:unnamed protein product, partial [Meganyctiphanes norvegica]
NIRTSQSLGNLSNSNKAPNINKHPPNKGPTKTKRPDIHKHIHGPKVIVNVVKVIGHQVQTKRPFPKAPQHQGPFSQAPHYVRSFPNPPRYPRTPINVPQHLVSFPSPPRVTMPSFNRQQHHDSFYNSFHQERAPPYENNIPYSTSASFEQMTFTDPPPPYDAPPHPGVSMSEKNTFNLTTNISNEMVANVTNPNSTSTSLGYRSFKRPPPPYEAQSHPGVTISENKSFNLSNNISNEMVANVTGNDIASALSRYRNQFTDAESLGLQVKLAPKDVVEVVKKHEEVFGIMMDGNDVMIELCPKIKLCADYLTSTGCNSVGTCRQLHLCRYFITNDCFLGDKCQFGHSWETNQNQATLKHFLLNKVDRTILANLVRKSVLVGLTPRICYYYNKGTCRKNDFNCNDLHICHSYVNNVGDCRKDICSLHHDIRATHCKVMLDKYGISTNDSPRDLLFMLTSESKQNGNATNVSNFPFEKCFKRTDNDVNEGLNNNFEKSVRIKEED